ncbi:uncharacterized protein LOC102626616 isoform X6 [Citrus sinensis]|uniref:uncharacterized protein LOC102626616 isoform X6 n=1 Tax=Citrus sinensis TaxID=2711 RepID=UPI000D623BF9|nr:uncharacterized protein LOC102626616 isoform X6 [Citrus sinensis]
MTQKGKMLLDYAKLRMVQWFLIYTHQSGGSLLIVEEIIFCRENWQKRRSCSFLPSKKLKKDLGSGIHMLLLLAIIWQSYIGLRRHLIKLNLCIWRPSKSCRNHLVLKIYGVAFHNLGQFYLVQRKLEDARTCYERALKIKGRVLGHGNIDYADTMYHLATVLYLQGKENDSEALFLESIRILEENGEGDSMTCIRRLRYLAQTYVKANRLTDAETVQRKILHIMESSKGWNSLDTVIAAEGLALTLQSTGSLMEAQELFERCLEARKKLMPQDHIQIGVNMLHIARVVMLNSNRMRKMNISEAIDELDRVKELLDNSTRIARHVLNKLIKQKGEKQNYGASGEALREGHTAFIILLQSLEILALLETNKQELQESKEEILACYEAENALLECISAYKEFGTEKPIGDSFEVKAAYLSCLKHLSSLISTGRAQRSKEATLQGLKDEIKRIEAEISSNRRRHKR